MKAWNEKVDPGSTLNRSADDEPVFVLVARDKIAAEAVQFWIDRARELGVNEAKIADARKQLEEIRRWPKTKVPD